METWELVVWIILVLIIIWQIQIELGIQTCYDGTTLCDGTYDWSPQEGDTPVDLLLRIETALASNKMIKQRRIAMISGFVLTILAYWYISITENNYPKNNMFTPKIWKFLMLWLLLFTFIWLILRYQESHMLVPIASRSKESLDELRYQLGYAVRPTIKSDWYRIDAL